MLNENELGPDEIDLELPKQKTKLRGTVKQSIEEVARAMGQIEMFQHEHPDADTTAS